MRYLLPLIIYHLLKFFAVAFFIFLSFLVLVTFCILLSFYNIYVYTVLFTTGVPTSEFLFFRNQQYQ
jgi:hypothetical protein